MARKACWGQLALLRTPSGQTLQHLGRDGQ